MLYLEGFVAVSGLWIGACFGAHGLVAGKKVSVCMETKSLSKCVLTQSYHCHGHRAS